MKFIKKYINLIKNLFLKYLKILKKKLLIKNNFFIKN